MKRYSKANENINTSFVSCYETDRKENEAQVSRLYEATQVQTLKERRSYTAAVALLLLDAGVLMAAAMEA